MIREHNFSGVFYPKDYASLVAEMENTFNSMCSSSEHSEFLNMLKDYCLRKKFLSFLIPHGSLRYSGIVSAFAFLLLKQFDCNNFIILSSDHKGTSPGISVGNHQYWTTPLGKVRVNENMAADLINRCDDDFVKIDPFSFEIDHTIETQLPFLQTMKKNDDFNFFPILQKNQDKKTSLKLAKLLTNVLPKDEKVVLLCTSNLSHYLNYAECYNTDKLILSEILKLDVNSFYDVIKGYSRLICGYGCIAVAMEFSKLVGNLDAVLLKHSTSGDIDGNRSSVVGYSSILMV